MVLSCRPSDPDLAVTPPPQKPFTPAKYFSIDRVFRNETLDATHLAEFHQIEGVIADRGLTLGYLLGVLREFFTKLGEQANRYGRQHLGSLRGCLWSHQPALANPYRNHPAALQTSLQPLHRAQHGSVQLPPRSGMGNWIQREVWGPHIWPGSSSLLSSYPIFPCFVDNVTHMCALASPLSPQA